MLRAVVDVNVLVSAMISPAGAPARILREWQAGAFELIVSPQLLAELERVLARPKVVARAAGAAAATVPLIKAGAALVEDPPAERLVPGDPGDDYLVALARTGRAHVIVTGDAHLLEADLRPLAVAPREFLARLADIP